ncbi:MAG: mannitol dehydrogenase family protein [Pseudoruegeria sp.]
MITDPLGTAPRLHRGSNQSPKVGIIHFGPGAFFRAFTAVYTAEAMAIAGGNWGVCAVSLRSATIRNKLEPQDYAYTSVTLAPDETRQDVIEVISSILVATEDPEAVLTAMAEPDVKIVSMTITEKGYCHNPSTGDLRMDHPDISHDLSNLNMPRSAIGYVVSALARRRLAGQRPFTILSCDNLPDNGTLTRRVVLSFAHAVSPDLAEWIEAEAKFPITMVDRITPATVDTDIASLSDRTGYLDLGCVIHEPFRQWVIQDDFVDGLHPDWGATDAQFVTDVAPFEKMKLRCLNGTHSALAYLGYLAGYETISDTVADPGFSSFVEIIWGSEIVPTVPQPEGENLTNYCADLKKRYQNPSIRHLTWQIAMDGSQKIPQRILGTIADCLNADRPFPSLALAIAGWMRFVGGTDEKGNPIKVSDPLADRLKSASDAHSAPADKVLSLLSISDIFDAKLAQNPIFVATVTSAYERLCQNGAQATINAMVGTDKVTSKPKTNTPLSNTSSI